MAKRGRKSGPPSEIPLTKIRTDGDTQRRDGLQESVIDDYVEIWQSGQKFPPINVVFDGEWYWLWDGFYRVESARRAGISQISAYCQEGKQTDAQWLSCGANKTHGMRRTREERDASIEYALRHEQGLGMTNKQIAKFVGCSWTTVQDIRDRLEKNGEIIHTRYLQTKGKRVASCTMEEEWVKKRTAFMQPPAKRKKGYLPFGEGVPIRDERGNTIPVELRPVFEGLLGAMGLMRNSIHDSIENLQKSLHLMDLNRLLPGPKRQGLEEFIGKLEFFLEESKRYKPYVVCTCTSGPPTDCPYCHGELWLNREEYTRRST